MRCNLPVMTVRDPFSAVRQDFERRMQRQPKQDFVGLTVLELEHGIELSFDVPGVDEANLEITIHDGVLNVTGERTFVAPEGAKEVYSDRVSGNFRRALKLDESIDPDSVDAVLNNGVLTITMKRRPELQPKRVAIRPVS